MEHKKILSANNPKILRFYSLQRSKEKRKKENLALVFGRKFIEDIAKTYPPQMVLFTNESCSMTSSIYETTADIISKIMGIRCDSGSIALFEIPPEKKINETSKLLVLDRIKDPGNLGCIIRSALCFGWNQIFLLPGSCDPFNEKVIRSSAGATFFIQRETGDLNRLKEIQQQNELTPLVADTQGSVLSDLKCKKPLVVISSESFGPSSEIKEWAKRITIPMNQVESLNAASAAAIICYSL